MNAPIFGARLQTLPQIFENHFFIIPDYQRGYAWDEKQVQEMLTDIDNLIRDNQILRHYTGTLVLSNPRDLLAGNFHVVDGQQRLTTLVILMRLLIEYLPEDEKASCYHLYIKRGGVGNEKQVLSTNSDTKLFFNRVILGNATVASNPMSLESHSRLLEAKKLINDWLKKNINGELTGKIIKNTVEKEMGFLVYAPAEDAETGIMFEVINNRGKALSELEKVKNYLIYCSVKLGADTLRENINADWSEILRNMNIAKKTALADESAFLRYCSAIYFELGKSESQYGYDEIKKKLDIGDAIKDDKKKLPAIKLINSFVIFMKNAALWYARLYGQVHEGLNAKLIAILDQMRAQDRHASIMPLFLALVIKEEEDAISTNVIRLLGLLEILNFRVYMAVGITARADSGQANLYWLASQYFQSKLLNSISEGERKIGNQLISTEFDALEFKLVDFVNLYSPDSLYKESFILQADSPFDFYNWGGLRYFLMNYEARLQPNKTIQIDKIKLSRSDGKSADYLSVEHVWALDNRNNEGENDRKIDLHEKRRLGNFVLLELRLNIKGGKFGIEDKLPLYLGKVKDEPPTDLMQVREMAKNSQLVLRSYSDQKRTKGYYLEVYKTINNKQEKRFTDFAVERWSINEYLGYRYLFEQNKAED